MITERRPSHTATPLPLARRLAYASTCILFSGLIACGDSDGPMDPGGNESQVAQIQVSLG
ncbi:MAG: hypothetical protein HKN73_08645, partial [Gemmatimonadetes bacterium]|nr:hypothetical protein [Gemmatimonadota bacterium]